MDDLNRCYALEYLLAEGSMMVSKVITRLEDDLDGSEAAETVRFTIDGVDYEIDLSESNAAKFRGKFENYISHARKVGGRTRRARTDGMSSHIDNQSVRKWAASNGIELSKRGRIPADIISQYQAAGN